MELCNNIKFLAPLRLVLLGIDIIKIVVPLILVVVCMISLFKMVFKEEKDLSEAFQVLYKKFILAFSVYIVPTIVTLLLSIISDATGRENCIKNAKQDSISAIANNQINEIISNTIEGEYSTVKYNELLGLIDYISNEEEKKVMLAQINQYKEMLDKEIEEKNNENKSNGDFVVDKLGDMSKLIPYIHGSEGGTTEAYACTVPTGVAAGEPGYIVFDLEGVGIYSTAYGLTSQVIGFVGSSCFSGTDYSYYYSGGYFKRIGACIPAESFPEALACITMPQYNYMEERFNKACMDSGIDFASTFSEPQIHSLLDYAHNSGAKWPTNALLKFCQSYNVYKDREKADDALWYEIFNISGNYWDKNNNGHYDEGDDVCGYIARRECAARLYFNGDYDCDRTPPFDYRYQKYHSPVYKCAR